MAHGTLTAIIRLRLLALAAGLRHVIERQAPLGAWRSIRVRGRDSMPRRGLQGICYFKQIPLKSGQVEDLTRFASSGIASIRAGLEVDPGTVKSHHRHVYEKLGVPDRAAAVAEAMRRGLLP
jgi:hypothetical protein